MDRLFSKIKRIRKDGVPENAKKQKNQESDRNLSYLDYLVTYSERNGQSLEQIIQADLDVDLSKYSPAAKKGFTQFLKSLKGFGGRPVTSFDTTPVVLELASEIPEHQRGHLNFVQAYLFDPDVRDAVVRSCALLNDHPDELSRMVHGRLQANYFGKLFGRRIGDEAIQRIAELSDCEKQIEEELDGISAPDPVAAKEAISNRLRSEAAKIVDRTFGEDMRIAVEYDPNAENGYWTALLKPLDEMIVSRKIFLACTRQLRQNGGLLLENIRDCSLEVAGGYEISESDAKAILEIQTVLYRNKYPQGEMIVLQKELSEALKSRCSRFYLYKKDGEVISFLRFDDPLPSDNRDKRYIASFMTNPKFEGGALGQALLEVALQTEMKKGRAIQAVCDPGLVPFYEKFGFKKIRQYTDDHGVETCDIVLEPESGSLREAA